jgi:hypothetical protein
LHIQWLIKQVWNKDARIFIGGRGIRIVVNSKSVFTQLVEEYHIPVGEGKCAKVTIPQSIEQDWNLAKHTIRGIVDTDGSIFVADKPGSPKYPSIEITTCSFALATQLKELLSTHGFRVANIWGYQRANVRLSYKVALNGYKNLERWLQEIGFSNPVKRRKAEAALADGFIPRRRPSRSGRRSRHPHRRPWRL